MAAGVIKEDFTDRWHLNLRQKSEDSNHTQRLDVRKYSGKIATLPLWLVWSKGESNRRCVESESQNWTHQVYWPLYGRGLHCEWDGFWAEKRHALTIYYREYILIILIPTLSNLIYLIYSQFDAHFFLLGKFRKCFKFHLAKSNIQE